MECFHPAISRTLCRKVQILRKVVSAEPNIAFHSTKTSVYDSNVFLNCPSKSWVTWCIHMGDMRESVILRDIYRFPLLELKLCTLPSMVVGHVCVLAHFVISKQVHATTTNSQPWSLPTHQGGMCHPQWSGKPQHCSGYPWHQGSYQHSYSLCHCSSLFSLDIPFSMRSSFQSATPPTWSWEGSCWLGHFPLWHFPST